MNGRERDTAEFGRRVAGALNNENHKGRTVAQMIVSRRALAAEIKAGRIDTRRKPRHRRPRIVNTRGVL